MIYAPRFEQALVCIEIIGSLELIQFQILFCKLAKLVFEKVINTPTPHLTFIAQRPEMILYKIEKTFNMTYTGLKSSLQRLQICSFQSLSCKGVESTI